MTVAIITTPPSMPDLLGTSPADLLPSTGERHDSTRAEAVERAERLRAGDYYRAMGQLGRQLKQAYESRDWELLGYASWEEYVSTEFGSEGRQLAERYVPGAAAGADTRTVYFIQAATGGLIKIGVAADPSARLAEIQRMCPIPLRILSTLPGIGQRGEKALHQRFAAERRHGEWFALTAEQLHEVTA